MISGKKRMPIKITVNSQQVGQQRLDLLIYLQAGMLIIMATTGQIGIIMRPRLDIGMMIGKIQNEDKK
jgi:hypothetical protein